MFSGQILKGLLLPFLKPQYEVLNTKVSYQIFKSEIQQEVILIPRSKREATDLEKIFVKDTLVKDYRKEPHEDGRVAGS